MRVWSCWVDRQDAGRRRGSESLGFGYGCRAWLKAGSPVRQCQRATGNQAEPARSHGQSGCERACGVTTAGMTVHGLCRGREHGSARSYGPRRIVMTETHDARDEQLEAMLADDPERSRAALQAGDGARQRRGRRRGGALFPRAVRGRARTYVPAYSQAGRSLTRLGPRRGARRLAAGIAVARRQNDRTPRARCRNCWRSWR